MGALSRAASGLAARDPVLAHIIDCSRPFALESKPDLYRDLLQSIISQQLSVRAADTIYGRLLDLFPRRRPSAPRLAAMTDAQLRAAGVSRQKAGYLRNVARFAMAGGLRRARLEKMSDEDVIRHLTRIKGVGRWTAEMLLMFSLRRRDILPVDDVGIQSAMKSLYGLRGRGRRLHGRMKRIAEAWRPHRTLACLFLWRSRRSAP